MHAMTTPQPWPPEDIPPHGVWWHVYPLGLLGAERAQTDVGDAVAHRLPRLIPWLDYSLELGVSGWVLGPVFSSATHGYDTVDHFAVDRRLGDTDDLVALIDAAHARGLRIVLDGVFNHVGRDFAQFRAAVAGGPDTPEAGWFHLDWPQEGGTPRARNFEGHDQLVALNHGNQQVVDYVVDVMRHWDGRGVDGWRLDAAYAVPTDFWRQVTARVRESAPRRPWIFGEVIHGDYVDIVAAADLDAVTQYELWKAIGSSLNDANFFELAHALGRHQTFLASFVPVTFLGNHDTTRIASQLADAALLPHALAVLFSVGGTPTIYAGDEQGYRGVKYEREGGDDEVRPVFPEHPGDFSEVGRGVFDLHRAFVGFRNDRPWLTSANTEVNDLSNTACVLVSTGREDPGGHRIATALNLADAPAHLGLPSGPWQVALGDGEVAGDRVNLPPRGWAILRP